MAIDRIVTQFVTQGEGALRGTLQALAGDMDGLEGKQQRLGMASNALIGGGAALAGVLGLVGAKSLGAAGQIEGVEAGLTSMLGSADAAKSKIKELQNFAATTPFDFTQTAKASQQLLAMGFAGEELIPTLNGVGNAVAAAGGSTEEFRGVLLALGQIQTKGKLVTQELLQMAERGIPAFQILQKQLGLTGEQVADIGTMGISAEVGIAALLKGMGEIGGGNALEEMSETLPGKLSNMGDAAEQAAASFGKLFSTDAKAVVGSITNMIEKTDEFIKNSPGMAKAITYALGGGAGVAIAIGVLAKGAGVYNELGFALGKATKGKRALQAATVADDMAEKAKTVTALAEGKAIGGVGAAARRAATAKKGLSVATTAESAVAAAAALKISKIDKARVVASKELSRAMQALQKAKPGSDKAVEAAARIATARGARASLNVAGNTAKSNLAVALKAEADAAARLAVESGKATSKLTMLQRAKLLASKPLGTTGSSTVPQLQKGSFRHMAGTPDGGRLFSSAQWNANKMAAAQQGMFTNSGSGLRTAAAFGRGGAPVTVGGAAMGLGAGVVAGVSASNNMKSAGYTDGESYMYGAATGIGAAAVSMFIPGGAVAVALGEGVAALFNKTINEPMEKAAEEGSGLSDEQNAAMSAATPAGKAALNMEEARKRQAEADSINTDFDLTGDATKRKEALESEAAILRQNAQIQNKVSRKTGTYGTAEFNQANTARNDALLAGMTTSSVAQQRVERGMATKRRDGSRQITLTLPEGDGDRNARQLDFNSRTAAPVY